MLTFKLPSVRFLIAFQAVLSASTCTALLSSHLSYSQTPTQLYDWATDKAHPCGTLKRRRLGLHRIILNLYRLDNEDGRTYSLGLNPFLKKSPLKPDVIKSNSTENKQNGVVNSYANATSAPEFNNTLTTDIRNKIEFDPPDINSKGMSETHSIGQNVLDITNSSGTNENATKSTEKNYLHLPSFNYKTPARKRIMKIARKEISPRKKIDPNAPITLSDLEIILKQNGYIRKEEVSPKTKSGAPQKGKSNAGEQTKSAKTVAFPQPSTIQLRDLKLGTAITSSTCMLFLFWSIRPNFWLIGSLFGAYYGADIATKYGMQKEGEYNIDDDSFSSPPAGLYGELTLKTGRKVASLYLIINDFCKGVWFMYRTGQLSYEYYKTYELLDKKFAIQNKMDAWNARFVEGKRNFDAWESENEVGRKMLAGLRTAWLLEEKSYKSQIGSRSKYRLIQYAIDIIDWLKRFTIALWGTITGSGNSDLREILMGIKSSMVELNLEIVSQRAGASAAALIGVNLIGALFALAPQLLGLCAIICGIVWPNWLGVMFQSINEVMENMRARGRGEKRENQTDFSTKLKGKTPVDRKNFHYFIDKSGKKSWYRTGQSFFKKIEETNDSFFSFMKKESSSHSDKPWWIQ